MKSIIVYDVTMRLGRNCIAIDKEELLTLSFESEENKCQ